MAVIIVADHQTEESYIARNEDTGELAMILRDSTAREDEVYLRQQIEILRFNWLGVLGYDYDELGFA